MFNKIKAWLKGRLLSRKQLHDANDPANKAFEALAGSVQTAATSELEKLAEQEASKL